MLLTTFLLIACGGSGDDITPVVGGEVKDLFLSLKPDSVYFTTKGGVQTVELSTSGEWKFLKVPDWLTISPNEGNGSKTLSVTATPNNSKSARSRKLTISWSGGNAVNNSYLYIEQFKDSLIASPMSFFEDGSAQELKEKLKITTVCGWKASVDQNWCRLNKVKGTGDDEITISLEENNTLDVREAIITIQKDTTKTLQMEFVKVVLQQQSRNLPFVILYSFGKTSVSSNSADFKFSYLMGLAGEGYTSMPITEVGLCYSTSVTTPSIENSTSKKVELESPYAGSAEGSLAGLNSQTKYYVRAYAKCEYGISYSDVETFTTK